MSWVRLDDGFVGNEKVECVTDRAFRLHVAALCHCAKHLTDGLVTRRAAKVLMATVSATGKHIAELGAALLWLPHEDGYLINDYLEYNPDAATVKADRARNAERQREHRARRNEVRNDVDNALRNGARNGGSNGAPLPFLSLPPASKVRSLSSTRGTDRTPLGKLREACRVAEGSDDEKKLVRAMRGVVEQHIVDIAASAPGDVRSRLGWTLAELKRRRAA